MLFSNKKCYSDQHDLQDAQGSLITHFPSFLPLLSIWELPNLAFCTLPFEWVISQKLRHVLKLKIYKVAFKWIFIDVSAHTESLQTRVQIY